MGSVRDQWRKGEKDRRERGGGYTRKGRAGVGRESLEYAADTDDLDLLDDELSLEDLRTPEEERVFSDEQMLDLAERSYVFCQEATGVRLFEFQAMFARRLIQSIFLEDLDEITALFARQSGKTETVAVVVVGLMVLLPSLAKQEALAADGRIRKFEGGFWVGIFGPTYELAGIMHARVKKRMSSQRMVEVMSDPDIGLEAPKGRRSTSLQNGSLCDCNSASPGTKIEGKTYHLILCEETQDIPDYKIRKSIHPMAAFVGGTIVKIGTPGMRRNEFHDACRRNRTHDIERGSLALRRHFQFDYRYASKVNPRYARFIKKEIKRLGIDSDAFRMSYRLHWLESKGHLVVPDVVEHCGVEKRRTRSIKYYADGEEVRSSFVWTSSLVNNDRTTEGQVAAIDFGKTTDSTVITVARAWWENPVLEGDEERYPTHAVNWYELEGSDHEAQYPDILRYLGNHNLAAVIVDATGLGDPIASRLAADLRDRGVRVVRFVFSAKSKHYGYKLMAAELKARRLTYPSGKATQRTRKWRKFVKQTMDLEKKWKGKWMSVEAPKRSQGERGHDDYPDSLMMLCWLVNKVGLGGVEMSNNPFRGASQATERRVERETRRQQQRLERITRHRQRAQSRSGRGRGRGRSGLLR